MKQSQIFLDSGDPLETKKAKKILGFLHGQTTNPSLVAKNPQVQSYIQKGKKLTESELLSLYKDLVKSIRKEIDGSISIEIYADWETPWEKMVEQAQEMNTWIENAHIKFPTIPQGVKAAHEFSKIGGKVNMTLVFDQEQAASVYVATIDSEKTHFVSPFVGRWDDRKYQGLDLVANIVQMYQEFTTERNKTTSHVKVLSASIRNLHHLYSSMVLGADSITVPLNIIEQWVRQGKKVPGELYQTRIADLQSIDYERIPLCKDCNEYMIEQVPGSLLDEGLQKFAQDWKKLIQ